MATVGSLAIVLTASATDFERTMGRAARTVRTTEREFMRSARNMERIGKRWSMGVTAPILAGFAAVGKAAMDWEDAFAGVRKTVRATEAELAELEESLSRMTATLPLSHQEIAKIAETAGQLGIAKENIVEFTRVMAMLGSTTTLTAEGAASALAQIDNMMQSGQKHFDRYGATVLAVGNSLATTESKIVDFSLKIAGVARIAGLTEAQVIGIAGAFGSVGIEAEAGGTAVQMVLKELTESVAMGDARLAKFAKVAGMGAQDFAQLPVAG